MKAVIPHVTDEMLAERRRTGIDRWDEMWEGVLHMPPAPSDEHQRIIDTLIEVLRPLLRESWRGTLRSGINVFGAPGWEDYRIPDLTFVAAGREAALIADGAREAPDAVVEIRSPDDETYEKLSFFARLGVREVIVIDRDTKAPEVFRLAGGQYRAVPNDAEGWVVSQALDVRFRRGDAAALVFEDLRPPFGAWTI